VEERTDLAESELSNKSEEEKEAGEEDPWEHVDVEEKQNVQENAWEEHVLFVQEKNAEERKDVSELELEDTENFTVEWELEDIEDTTTEDTTEE